MKLSELIWGGAKKRPPTKTGWSGKDEHGQITTCAMMAALDAAGLVVERGGFLVGSLSCSTRLDEPMDRVTGQKIQGISVASFVPPPWFLALIGVAVEYPCKCKTWNTFFEAIPHLHDAHQWTREAVAMWVESIEKDLERRREVLCPGWGGRAPAKVGELVTV